jgi:Protein of unknown function (DUF3426)
VSREPAARTDLKSQFETAGVPTLFAPDVGLPSGFGERRGPAEHETETGEHRTTTGKRTRSGRATATAEVRESAVADAEDADAESDAEEDAPPAPAFLKGGRHSRGFSVVFGGGSILLGLLLLAQFAVVFRTELTTRLPAARPAVLALCEVFGCTVSWPTRAELLVVVGTEMQAVPGTDIFELTAVVRNRASFKVALPAIEVTLTDVQNRPLARKVFAPVDYLASNGEASSRLEEGLGGGSDYVVRMTFEARGLNASGFVVYPFYL